MQQRAAACEAAWFGPGQREIVARLRADQDNLRAALAFGLTGAHPTPSAALTPSTDDPPLLTNTPCTATDTPTAPAAAGPTSSAPRPTRADGHSVRADGHPTPADGYSASADGHPTPADGYSASADGHPTPADGHSAPANTHPTPADALAALRLAGTLWFYWHACGAPREGRYWLDRALEASPEPTPERARALWVAGLLAGCPEDLTRGRRRAEEARSLARRLGVEAEAAHAEYVLGVILLFSDDLHAALAHFRACVERGRVPGQHLSLVGLDRVELACALGFLGEADQAIAVCEEARRMCERHGEEWVLSYVHRMLALAHTVKKDHRRAERHAREALRLKLAVNDIVGIGLTLDLLAQIAAQSGAHDRAAVLLGGADRVWADVDRDRWGSAALDSTRRGTETRAREALGAAAYERSYEHGATLGLTGVAGHVLDERPEQPGPEQPTAERPQPGVRLTRRETQVAELIAEGLANQQIADRLVIARRTAEGHVERILSKLGFSNRSQIAAWITAQR
ncbi:LuxR C-terminal-related transcriptional regulator [Streptomyces sp. TRM70350]|nr:LuxR C-terminal-related transcriptional regulator [Streptomyces sp. TRM70350]